MAGKATKGNAKSAKTKHVTGNGVADRSNAGAQGSGSVRRRDGTDPNNPVRIYADGELLVAEATHLRLHVVSFFDAVADALAPSPSACRHL